MRHTFLLSDHDCGEEVPVEIERVLTPSPSWDSVWMDESYRLVSWPSVCKCGRPIPLMEASQAQLRDAYHLNEAEDV